MANINWLKVAASGASIVIGIATMISNYAEKKQNEKETREISREEAKKVFDEQYTKVQEAKFEEIDTTEEIA